MTRLDPTAARASRSGGRGQALPLALFLVSGAAGLVIEVVALETLARVFGTAAEAAAATLAAFFLGLGLGAVLGGRVAPRLARPLLAYGVVELLVGLLALALLAVPALAPTVRGSRPGGLLLALLALGPAAVGLGATFPLLAEHGVRGGSSLGRGGALLVAANALGAAGGAFLAGFVLPLHVGYRGTLLVASAACGAVGLVAVLAGGRPRIPRGEGGPARSRGAIARPAPADARALAFAVGFVAMALQVLSVRSFARALPASVHVFTLVLVMWLVALALGGLVARALATGRGAARAPLAPLLALAGVLVATSVPLLLALTGGLAPPPPDQPWASYLGRVATDLLIVVLPPVVLLGAVFPSLLRVAEQDTEAGGRAAGQLAAWNTGGCVLGPLVAAFVLLPYVGLWGAVGGLAILLAALAVVVACAARGRAGLAVALAALAATTLMAARSAPVAVRLAPGETLVALCEGASGSVAVVARDGDRTMLFDNVFTLGGSHDARWEALQGHVPLCLHPAPRRALFVGLGTGITAAAALEHDLERLEVLEIVPGVIDLARQHFAPWAGALFTDPRAAVLAGDGRHHLAEETRSWDVVVGDLFFPWQPGTASLYAREHLETVRARLAPGGVFAQWLPCYQLSPEEVRGILRTFVEAFPRVSLWRGDFFAGRPILAVVGHRDDGPLDGAALVANARRLVAGEGADLARDAASIPFCLYAGDLTAARALFADARPITDDRPWLQWTAPRSERRQRTAGADLFVGDVLLAFETALLQAVPPDEDPFLVRLGERERRLVEAGLALRRMAVHLAAFRRREHVRALADVVRLVPEAIRPPLDRWIEGDAP